MGGNIEDKYPHLAGEHLKVSLEEEVRSHAEAGDLEAANRVLESAISAGNCLSPLQLSRLAQEIGSPDLALRLLTSAVRQSPNDDSLVTELAELHEDLGHREDLSHPTSPMDTPQCATDPLLMPDRADLVRFLHLFGGREDVHARQWSDPGGRGGYSPIKAPLTPDLAQSHLAGSVTLGVYPIRLDGTVNFFALDLDIRKAALQRAAGDEQEFARLRHVVHQGGLDVLQQLNGYGLPLLLEDSGFKGRHLWGFLERPLPASLVHKFGTGLLRRLVLDSDDLSMEFFPKQGKICKDGLGNLIKLPLGIHRRSGRRGMLLDEKGNPMADPWPAIRQVERIGREPLLDLMTGERQLSQKAERLSFPQHRDAGHPISLEVDIVLEKCAVLREIFDRANSQRRLSYDERLVLHHSLGHLDGGVDVLNQLYQRCPEVPERAFLKRALRGHPVSCPRIRSRLPNITSILPCHCSFGSLHHYPTPILHRPAPAQTPSDSAGAGEAPEENTHPADAFAAELTRAPGQRLEVAGGIWTLREIDGVQQAVWAPQLEE
ncbi:MAG: hypothetical protein HN348_01905 [Proteobacteria bacterium]|jgi:hypothetical protein|nr:hypothetical protein [Pseudomonadota bacterium]